MRRIVSASLAGAAGLAVAIALGATSAGARDYCKGSGTPLPTEQIMSMLNQLGYTGVREIENEQGCYEAKGKDKDGNRVEVYLEPATGQIVKVK